MYVRESDKWTETSKLGVLDHPTSADWRRQSFKLMDDRTQALSPALQLKYAHQRLQFMSALSWKRTSLTSSLKVHECLAPGLTSKVSEVDGLPVGVEQLDDGVVIILHSAADGGRFALNHGHVVSRQVLALHYRENIHGGRGGDRCFIELRNQISTD